jgi:hypothetical protein
MPLQPLSPTSASWEPQFVQVSLKQLHSDGRWFRNISWSFSCTLKQCYVARNRKGPWAERHQYEFLVTLRQLCDLGILDFSAPLQLQIKENNAYNCGIQLPNMFSVASLNPPQTLGKWRMLLSLRSVWNSFQLGAFIWDMTAAHLGCRFMPPAMGDHVGWTDGWRALWCRIFSKGYHDHTLFHIG